MAKSECPKCGSTEVVRNVRLTFGSLGLLSLSGVVLRDTGPIGLLGAETYPFRTHVCAGCGYTEFYMRLPAKSPRPAQRPPAPPKRRPT